MKSTIRLLTLVLLVQVAASIFTFQSGDSLATFKAEEPLVNLSLDALSKIQITINEEDDSQDRTLTIEKSENGWILPDYFSFPVSSKKLDLFRNNLFTLKKPFPVGSTKAAAKQFEVSKDGYQTKVEFLSDDSVKETLYFGSSPSFKKIHVSSAQDPLSYSIGFSGFELRAKEKNWIDKRHLSIPRAEVTALVLPDYSLQQSEDGKSLVLSDLDSGTEEMAAAKLTTLLKATAEPTFLDILSTENKEEYGLATPELSYTITRKDGSEKTYSYGKVKDESHFALEVSGDDRIYKVSNFQIDKVKEIKRSDLVKAIKKEEAAPTEEGMTSATEEKANTEESDAAKTDATNS